MVYQHLAILRATTNACASNSFQTGHSKAFATLDLVICKSDMQEMGQGLDRGHEKNEKPREFTKMLPFCVFFTHLLARESPFRVLWVQTVVKTC